VTVLSRRDHQRSDMSLCELFSSVSQRPASVTAVVLLEKSKNGNPPPAGPGLIRLRY